MSSCESSNELQACRTASFSNILLHGLSKLYRPTCNNFSYLVASHSLLFLLKESTGAHDLRVISAGNWSCQCLLIAVSTTLAIQLSV